MRQQPPRCAPVTCQLSVAGSGSELPQDLLALTVWQPWAAFIAWLGKSPENRPWPCPRGRVGERIAIHAGQTIDRGPGSAPCPDRWPDLFASRAEWDAWHRHWINGGRRDEAHWPPKLAVSAVVATATIVGCHWWEDCCSPRSNGPRDVCSPWVG